MKNTIELSTKNPAWFKQWFDSSFYHQLYANRDENEAAQFIDALVSHLQPSQNATMLDLGCGAGRHAKHLASKGFTVTGLDLASNSIRTAKKSITPGVQFYQHDMRLPFGNNRFDYVFNFFTSFGYFKDEYENQAVITNIYNALRPGGTLVLDYINTAYSEARLVPAEEKEIDGIIYHLTRWSDESNFYKKIVIEDVQAGRPFEFTEQVAKFNLPDFEYMLGSNGLHIQQVFGDYDLNDYNTKTSPRLILIAER